MDDGYGGAAAYRQKRERDRLTAAENIEVERILSQLQSLRPQKSMVESKSMSMSRGQGVSDKENENDNELHSFARLAGLHDYEYHKPVSEAERMARYDEMARERLIELV